jgi:hypothetical protein
MGRSTLSELVVAAIQEVSLERACIQSTLARKTRIQPLQLVSISSVPTLFFCVKDA